MAATPTVGPLGLLMPSGPDSQDVGIINANMQTIDTWAAGVAGSVSGAIIPIVASGALISAYPLGTSMFYLPASAIGNDSGWDIGKTGVGSALVVTHKPVNQQGFQYWYRNGSQTEYYTRYMTSASNSTWIKAVGGDTQIISATADISCADGVWTKLTSGFSNDYAKGYAMTSTAGGVLVKEQGTYQVDVSLSWNANAGTSIVYIGIGLSTDAGPGANFRSTAFPGALACTMTGTWLYQMIANTTVIMFGNHSTGSNKICNNRRMTIRRVGEY